MKNDFDLKIIFDHLNHISTPQQQICLSEWLNESPMNKKNYTHIKKLWALKNTSLHSDPEETEKILRRINAIINSKIVKNRLRRRRIVILSIAAVFALLITSFATIHHIRENPIWITLATLPNGDVKTITLSDGSVVYLKRDSELSYPKRFTSRSRDVRIKGEAYFVVTDDSLRQFNVYTDNVIIRVLGTSFNVKIRNITEMTLEKGSISIESNNGNILGTLSPGQRASFNKSSDSLTIEDTRTGDYTAWRFGHVSYEDILLTDLLKSFEVRFGIDICVVSHRETQNRYDFVINEDDSITTVMETLKFITPIEYSFESPEQISVILR